MGCVLFPLSMLFLGIMTKAGIFVPEIIEVDCTLQGARIGKWENRHTGASGKKCVYDVTFGKNSHETYGEGGRREIGEPPPGIVEASWILHSPDNQKQCEDAFGCRTGCSRKCCIEENRFFFCDSAEAATEFGGGFSTVLLC